MHNHPSPATVIAAALGARADATRGACRGPRLPHPAGFAGCGRCRRLRRRPVDGIHAEAYLRARGLACCRFPALRFHPELRYREGPAVRRLPALVAAVTGNDGAVQGVHRTWLDPRRLTEENPRPDSPPSRAFRNARRPRHSAPRRRGHRDRAVAGHRRAGDHRGSCPLRRQPRFLLGPARLFRPRHRPRQRPRGERAAQRLARRCARAGVAATVIVPEGGDFNDDMATLGADVLAARFGPIFRFPGAGEEGA